MKASSKTAHERSLNNQRRVIGMLFGVVVVLLAVAAICQHVQIKNLREDLNTKTQLLYSEVDSNAQASAPVVNPEDGRTYIPELRISLPYNDTTKTLRYTYSERDGARFYSTLVTDHATHTISCYDMVRVKHEAKPNAYSPGQPYVATVQAGHPPLQVYAEENVECAAQTWLQITPAQIADQLKQAQAY
jgi:hypothetical protein